MIRTSECYIRRLLLVLPFTIVSVVNATADPGGLIPVSPPLTMARFYIVDSDGRSAFDKSIPTQTMSRDHHSSEPRRKKSDRRNRDEARKAKNHSGSWNPMLLRLGSTKARQCERHGFFFTADGRCIRLVFHVKQGTPPMINRRPFRSNLRSK